MSVLFYPESIRILGSDTNGNNVMLCEMAVDDIANLPAANAFISDGYVLSMGCVATAINDNSKHRLNGVGNWVQIAAGTSTYTRAEIDALLLNKVDVSTYTTDKAAFDAEIAAVANAGAKNIFDVQRPTTTTRTSYTPLANGGVELSCSNATWTSYAIADIPVEVGKEYIITFLLDESSGTSNFYFFLRNGDSSGTNLATKNYGSATGNYEVSFTPSNSVIWLGIYLNNSATAATATAKLRCMIRPAAITDPTYEPYAPTNRQLYEMILQLQGG